MKDESRVTALGLFNFGLSFFEMGEAALTAQPNPAFQGPLEFAFGHGLELIFKADLRRTRSIKQVISYGHDLRRLRSAVTPEFVQNVGSAPDFEVVVEYLADRHGPPYESRYLRTGWRRALSVEAICKCLYPATNSSRAWRLSYFGDQS